MVINGWNDDLIVMIGQGNYTWKEVRLGYFVYPIGQADLGCIFLLSFKSSSNNLTRIMTPPLGL